MSDFIYLTELFNSVERGRGEKFRRGGLAQGRTPGRPRAVRRRCGRETGCGGCRRGGVATPRSVRRAVEVGCARPLRSRSISAAAKFAPSTTGDGSPMVPDVANDDDDDDGGGR